MCKNYQNRFLNNSKLKKNVSLLLPTKPQREAYS